MVEEDWWFGLANLLFKPYLEDQESAFTQIYFKTSHVFSSYAIKDICRIEDFNFSVLFLCKKANFLFFVSLENLRVKKTQTFTLLKITNIQVFDQRDLQCKHVRLKKRLDFYTFLAEKLKHLKE